MDAEPFGNTDDHQSRPQHIGRRDAGAQETNHLRHPQLERAVVYLRVGWSGGGIGGKAVWEP